MGNFSEEGRGGGVPYSQIVAFQQAMEDSGLIDLEDIGNDFTWCNRHKDHTWTRLRVNRGLTNFKWQDLFPHGKVKHLVDSRFDHIPIILEWWGGEKQLRAGKAWNLCSQIYI